MVVSQISNLAPCLPASACMTSKIEVLENRDFIQQICQRIPEDYNPPEPISLHPMDLSYLSPIVPVRPTTPSYKLTKIGWETNR